MQIGRWLTADPSGKGAAKLDDPQTWNLYAYVRNDPMTLTDPSGSRLIKRDPTSWVVQKNVRIREQGRRRPGDNQSSFWLSLTTRGERVGKTDFYRPPCGKGQDLHH